MTADLQLTAAQAAKIMNVSERMAFMARRIMRDRPDLVPEIESGRITVGYAYKLTTGKASPTRLERLVKAWNAASEEDRAWLLERVTRP